MKVRGAFVVLVSLIGLYLSYHAIIAKVSPHTGEPLLVQIEQEVSSMTFGEKKEIQLHVSYDYVVITSPYIDNELLKKSGISSQLVASIQKSLTLDERCHLFVIKDDQIQNYIILNEKFSSERFPLKINAPAKLRVEMVESHVPYKLIPLSTEF